MRVLEFGMLLLQVLLFALLVKDIVSLSLHREESSWLRFFAAMTIISVSILLAGFVKLFLFHYMSFTILDALYSIGHVWLPCYWLFVGLPYLGGKFVFGHRVTQARRSRHA